MSTATLRPNATITAAGSVTGAASEHAALSDDSDSSYVTVSAEQAVYALGTTTIGSGSVTKQIRVRYRNQTTAGATPSAWVAPASDDSPYAIATPTDDALQTWTSAYSAVSLSQTTIDGLRFLIETTGTAEAYEAYVDLVYVTQPSTTVTAVSPDPYTASSVVPIEWTNTLDSDGGAQTRYEVKVFTDAQYGAGGFDPDTSTPYYTTGVVVSAATTADVGPLEDGDTYRAYVRVAQTVNGSSHWSDWANDTFTMDVATSDVDTVTAVANNSTGAIAVIVAWDSGSTGWEYMEVQRSIDAGTTWTDVRGATYVATTDSGATDFTITDYEVPNGQSVIYRARATYLSSSLPITGAWVESSATSWTSDNVFLKAPNDSTKNMSLSVDDDEGIAQAPNESYDIRQGVFSVLGSARPVVISDTRQDPDGVLVVQVASIANAANLRTLLNETVILVHAPSTYDLGFEYIAPGRVRRERFPRPIIRHERWEIEYVEVDSPTDPDAGR